MPERSFPRPAPRSRAGRRRAGFTLIEVMIAAFVTVTAVLGLLRAVTAGADLQEQTQQYGIAGRAIHAVHESLREGDLDARVADLKANPTFADGPITVAVQFPESLLVDLLGAPVPAGWRYRDLDADGEVDLDPAATSPNSLVPVTVTSTWDGGRVTSSFMVTQR